VKLQNGVSRSIANRKRNIARKLMRPFLKYFYDTYFVMGSPERLKIGERSALANTLFNVSSGNITVGNRSIFGQGVMVITGRHEFRNGMRISLDPEEDDGSWGGNSEVPKEGFDIFIGDGVFVASGAIILGKCHIGNNCIVAAGAVVTKSFPDYSIIAGIPAKLIGDTRDRK
jgi:acetyltransferase-like isoleucine patch superfamily enzyme